MTLSIRQACDQLDAACRSYREFHRIWTDEVRPTLGKPPEAGYRPPTYEPQVSKDENEVRFALMGAAGYVRFKHDTQRGVLEYGAVRPSTTPGGEQRLPFAAIPFDEGGCGEADGLPGGVLLTGGAEVWKTHVRMLAMHACLFVSLYYQGRAPEPE